MKKFYNWLHNTPLGRITYIITWPIWCPILTVAALLGLLVGSIMLGLVAAYEYIRYGKTSI